MHADRAEHILLVSRLWHASSPRGRMPGFACHRLIETSFPLLLPPPPSASLSAEVWRRETETERGTRWFLFSFHCFFLSFLLFSRTCFAVHAEKGTLKTLSFLLYDSSTLDLGQNPLKNSNFFYPNTLLSWLLNIEQRKPKVQEIGLYLMEEKSGHD